MEKISYEKDGLSFEVKYSSLIEKLDSMADKDRIIFAIEGCSGSGKTTLAKFLQGKYDCNVFHMDDFF